MKLAVRVLCFFAFAVCAFAASTPTPTLYFTDLTSGPAGAIVTVYGANLLNTISVNGVNAGIIASSSSKVSFVIPNTTSGSIAMAGSNTLPFTVRPGNIYYVATNGSDSNTGSQTSPWATIPHAFNTASCGDIIYARDGVSQTGLDNYGASLSVKRICTQAEPLALVGYPGAIVTIGSTNGQEYGIRNPDVNGDGYNGMVFANLVVRANNTALKDVNNSYWRIVGSDFSCPNGGGQAACVQLDYASYVKFLGNSIHDTGAGGTKYYHSFYATTNSVHIEVGWSHIYNNKSCRGIQFYSTGGSPQYDLIVHDNIVSGQECDGINFSTVDATKGPIEAYNNVVYHVGLGGTTDGTPNYACIASLGYGAPGGQLVLYGNTLADCGSAGGSTAGAVTVLPGSPAAVLSSNLAIQNPGEVVYSPNTDRSLVSETSDVLLNNGTSGVVNSNYQPVAGSPAIGAGTAMAGILYDLAGTPRPQSGHEDAGAYLYGSSASTTPTASLSPGSLNFGTQEVDTSASQAVTLSNSGSSTLTISSIAVSGTDADQFRLTNDCGLSVPAGKSCTIQVQFYPTTTGAKMATVNVDTNAPTPNETVALSGSGVSASAPGVTVAPTSISFGNQPVNSTSAAQSVTVTNSGDATLTITGVTIAGTNASAFKMANGCGSTLAKGASCMIQVQFTPTTASTYNSVLEVSDNASGSPQKVSLSGTGLTSVAGSTTVHYALNNLYFYNRPVGSTSPASIIKVTNTGKSTFTINSLWITGPQASSFSASSNCAGIAPRGSCAISVKFDPKVKGTNTAVLSVASNASGSPKLIPLTGHGY